MKLLRNLIATAILAVMPLAMTTSASAQTFNNGGNGCSVVELAPLNKAFTVSGNTASTTVQVNGPATCKETVSLASWNAPVNSPNFRPFASQSLVAKKTVTLGVGQHVLSIPINSACAYQVDLVLGSRATNASGTADYTPDVMMGYLQVFNKMCTITPPTPPTPP
ncbi:MAG TPA: hypothetical protein VLG27_03450, partial [Candidatus Saccharimonadia bacterium]|nr:hypothetical protein [Candidatus Saccharimonadia bacterium]